MLRLRVLRPGDDALGGDRADIVHGSQLQRRGIFDGVHRAERARKHLGRLLPHLPDTERAQQARHARILALFNGCNEILGRLFAHMIQRRDRLRLEGIQLRR